VAGNVRGTSAPTPDDVSGGTVEIGSRNNLIGDANTAGGLEHDINANIVGNDGVGTINIGSVLDAVLRHNGGPTRTHGLSLASLARNAGESSMAFDFGGAALPTDQRGFARIRAGVAGGLVRVDIGAVEADPPVIGSFGGAVTYTENAPPVSIAIAATLTDPDSPNFATGRLVVKFTANGQAGDKLLVRPLGNVTVSGNNVLFKGQLVGQLVGRFAGGTVSPLVVSFNAAATPFKAQAVLRCVAYQHNTDNPSPNPRMVSAQISDGDGGTSNPVTKQVNVTPVNDAPVLAPADGGTVGYQQNTAQIALLSTATVTDVDTANFDGGRLLVRITSGGSASNRLRIGGGFELDGDLVKRTSDGLVIGTRNATGGVGTMRLEITFNADASRAIVEQLVRGIRFRTENGTSTAQRVIEFSLTDGDGGGASNKVNKTVNVSA